MFHNFLRGLCEIYQLSKIGIEVMCCVCVVAMDLDMNGSEQVRLMKSFKGDKIERRNKYIKGIVRLSLD